MKRIVWAALLPWWPCLLLAQTPVVETELTAEQATAQGIKAWIAANPARREELFNANPSFVFFREERLPDPSVGPKGALGVPLTPARSIAIDP